jgi:hypothetical protein
MGRACVRMKIDEFMNNLEVVLREISTPENKKLFAENMEHLNIPDQKFSEWMMTFLAWNELNTAEDCAEYYWFLERE